MRRAFKIVGIIIILALAAYGAYSLAEKTVSYIRYQKQYSSIVAVQNIKNGVTPLPDITLVSPEGEKVSLYDELQKEDFVILSFGSIYCGNCHEEYKALEENKMLEKIPENGEMFLVVPEERDFITQFEKDLKIHLPLYIIDKNLPTKLGITKIPTIILVGQDKKIKMYQTGFKESALKEMFDYMQSNGK
jgi:thiol-disulfide isomerase/thioredoxin